MSMIVHNNPAASMALGELNKNVKKAGDLLTRIATGQKIVGAKDDSAQYAISEKMREQIRSLFQDDQNVQNGSALFKTAAGAVDSIVEELRTLKELAINAANDTNNDSDRATIQKEFDHRIANINDIASFTNYNGKILIDGTYPRPNRETLDNVLSYIYDNYEGVYDSTGRVIAKRTIRGVGGSIDDRGIYNDGITNIFNLDQVTARNKIAPSVSWVNGRTVYGDANNQPVGGYSANTWIDLDFSGITRKDGSDFYAAADLHKQGFSIFCSNYRGCPSFHGFMFDSTKAVGTGEKVYNTSGPVYIVGTAGISNKSLDSTNTWVDNEGWDKTLENALFDGVLNAIMKDPNAPENYRIDENGNELIVLGGYGDAVELTRVSNDSDTSVSIMQHYALWIYEGYDTGAVYSNPLPPAQEGVEISITDPNYVAEVEAKTARYNPLTIHHGTHANQATHFFMNDMHTKSLKGGNLTQEDLDAVKSLDNNRDKQEELINFFVEAKYKTLDQASVRTKHDAKVSIRIIDGAIDYALNEATYLGAYLQRLEYTGANITVMNENVQAAESTIRDADMAKEMTAYTKFNVLTQSSQAMLAQANQNLSSVLSLLQ